MTNAINIPYDRTAEGRLLNVVQVMERLNCSRSFVYKLVGGGQLKALRIGEVKGLRVTEKSLERFKKHRKVTC
jgi:excisionase family DNA binding protein